MAQVGDRQIALSSAPIARAPYQEHKAIRERSEKEVRAADKRVERVVVVVVDRSLLFACLSIHPSIFMYCLSHPLSLSLSLSCQVSSFLSSHRISVSGCSLRPAQHFSESGLSPAVLSVTRDFTAPSPIQAQSWPIILSGRDMVGTAATGSGKTLAFGLPGLAHVLAQREAKLVERGCPVMLTIAPTRELSQQIHEVLEKAGKRRGGEKGRTRRGRRCHRASWI